MDIHEELILPANSRVAETARETGLNEDANAHREELDERTEASKKVES